METTSITVPAGTYIVGDPCYSVPNDMWADWLALATGYESVRRETPLYAELNGYPVAGICTEYGDGMYPASDGAQYPVDAGLLGVVHVGVAVVSVSPDAVQTVTFDRPFECYRDEDGVVHIGHISIYTGDTNGDEDLYEDEDDEDFDEDFDEDEEW